MKKKFEDILTKTPKHDYYEELENIDKQEFIKTVHNRRSVRVFNDSPINPNDLNECLELALLAPTSSNLQCWEFYWVKDPTKKDLLKEYCLNQIAAKTAQELIVCVARTDTWKKNKKDIINFLTKQGNAPLSALKYYKNIVPIVYTQGILNSFGLIKKVAVKIIGLFRSIRREPTSNADMRVWAHKTTALACENLMLALTAYGYDSCPMEGMDSKKIKQLLNLSNKSEISMVIAIGKRDKKGIYGKRFRLNSEKFIKIV